jgi:hypothetical protein
MRTLRRFDVWNTSVSDLKEESRVHLPVRFSGGLPPTGRARRVETAGLPTACGRLWLDSATVLLALIFALGILMPVWQVLWIKLFGTTEHTWMAVNHKEQLELETLYAQATAGRPKGRGEGVPFYRAAMVTSYGAAVYRNGIFAQWCVGRKSRYRFVPWKDLSGIYPVEAIARMFWLRQPYEGLQLETSTGLTLTVDTVRHDVPAFHKALDEALGPPLRELMRKNEVIHTSILDGRLGVHMMLRQRRGAYPVRLPPEGSLLVRPQDMEKGELLMQETEGDTRLRLLPYKRMAIAMLGTAIGAGILAALLYPVGAVVLLTVCGVSVLLVGFFVNVVRTWKAPAKLYEMGLSVFKPGGGEEAFYSFAAVSSVEQKKSAMSGLHYVFLGRTPLESFQMPAGSPFGDNVASEAERVLGHRVKAPVTAAAPP